MSDEIPNQLRGDPAVEGCLHEMHKITRKILVMLCLTVLPAAAWLGFAPLTSAVIANGIVKVDTNRQPIQHLQGGVAVEVRVREGQTVHAGQTLLLLGDVAVDADRQRLLARILGTRVSLARLEAEQRAANDIAIPADVAQAAIQNIGLKARLADELTLFNSHKRTLAEQASLLIAQKDAMGREVAALRSNIESSEQALNSQRTELAANLRMQREGFISGNRVLQLESTVAEYAAGLDTRRSDLARAQQRVIENELRYRTLLNEFRDRAADQHASLSLQLQEMQQEYRKALDSVERQNITAPVAGVVMGLRVQTPGSLVPARELIAEIVPATPQLLIEVSVAAQDISRVKLRQRVEVRFTAFRSPGTPPLLAEVVYVAPDRMPETPGRSSEYKVHVAANPEALRTAQSGGVEPRAGMAAQVFIHGETRSPLSYLLEPVVDLLRRAARER